MRTLWILWIAAFGCTPSLVEAEGASVPEPLLSHFIEAASGNPRLQSNFELWMAAREHVAIAKGWPDPRISFSYYLREVETALGPQKHSFELSQTLPWFGKLGAKEDAADQGAMAAGERFRSAALDLFAQVADAYYDLAYLERAIAITRENLELMRFHESIARARYRTDTVRYSDLIKLQVELGSLDDRLRTLEDRRRPLVATLNRHLGREGVAHSGPTVNLMAPASLGLSDDEIRGRSLRENPAMVAMRHDVAGQSALTGLARRNRYPDFMVGVKTIRTDESTLTNFDERGRDAWMVSVGLNLPIWQGKRRAAIRESVAKTRAAEYRLRDAQNGLVAQVETVLFALRDAARKIDLFEDGLVPKAQQSLESTATAYQAGTATFLDFLDAQRTLLMFELDLASARAEFGRRRVEVQSLMGSFPAGVETTLSMGEGADR